MAKKYLAVAFCIDPNSGLTTSLSREVETTDRDTILDRLMVNTELSIEEFSTIILVENGAERPNVIKVWDAQKGDIEDL